MWFCHAPVRPTPEFEFDAGAARGAPAWVEDAALGFLEASLDEFPRTDECEQASCTVFD